MGNFNPAGLSSQIKIEGKVFHLQTEFAQRPKPRITTSIILSGETIHKIDHPWEESWETEEERNKIDSFIKEQHEKAIRFIKENVSNFIKEETIEEEKEILKKEPQSILLDLWKKIAELPGIEKLTAISSDGSMFYSEGGDEFGARISPLVVGSNKFADLLSGVSRLGEFEGGIIETKQERIAFINYKRSILALAIKEGKDLKELLGEIKEVLKG